MQKPKRTWRFQGGAWAELTTCVGWALLLDPTILQPRSE
jgi:hypothetical protein